jgi:F-type H+-transporting ATPase subunit b
MTRSRDVSHRARAAGLLWPLLALGVTLVDAVPGWASEAGGGGGLIELNRSLLIQVVNFLVLLVVLYRIAYRPLMGMLETRSNAIKRQLAEAQAAREAAQRQLAEFEARLQAAQAEAEAVRQRALREASETRERLTAEARQEAARLLESARAEIARDVRRAKDELRAQVGSLAVEIAERLIQKSLRDEDHRRLVQDALSRIESR